MKSREQFEQFTLDLATRRQRAQAMSRSLQQYAAERFAGEEAVRDRRPVTRSVPTGAAVNPRLGALLLADARALTELTLEELRRTERELAQQNEALFDAQQELDVAGAHYLALFELAPAAYVVTSDSGVIRELNEVGASLLACPRNFAVGKPLALFVAAGADRAAFRVALNRARDATDVEVWRMRLGRSAATGAEVTVSVRTVRDASGAPAALYWLLREETDRLSDDIL